MYAHACLGVRPSAFRAAGVCTTRGYSMRWVDHVKLCVSKLKQLAQL